MSVSRVLNGNANVSSEMRRKVMRSIAKLGYYRNENARSLRPGQRSGLVGLIVTNIDNPYYAQVVLGIEDGLYSSGRRILVGTSHNDVDRERKLVRDFTARQVEGLVVVPCGGDESFLDAAQLNDVPLVLASREQPLVKADCVVIDDFEGSMRGVAEFISQGHRRIAFLGNAPTVSTSQRRFEGYARALGDASLTLSDELIHRTCHDQASATAATHQLLELDDPPTALFCANNQISVGALLALVPHNRRHPELPPIEVLGVDNFDMSELIPHPLTIIDHDARALGRAAAGMLVQRMDGDPQPADAIRLLMPTRVRRIHP